MQYKEIEMTMVWYKSAGAVRRGTHGAVQNRAVPVHGATETKRAHFKNGLRGRSFDSVNSVTIPAETTTMSPSIFKTTASGTASTACLQHRSSARRTALVSSKSATSRARRLRAVAQYSTVCAVLADYLNRHTKFQSVRPRTAAAGGAAPLRVFLA